MLFSKKNRIESSHCAFTFYILNIAPLHQKDNTIHANSCFSALLLIAFSSNYTICSKPLYNLFLIFFLAAVPFIYFDRAFMILCAHRAQLFSKIRLFLLCFPIFAQIFVSHAPVCGGAWRLGGRLVGGMAGLRRTVPVFLRRDGYTVAPGFQSILCKLQPLTRHSVRHLPYNKGGTALCKFATDLFEAAVSCCNFAQGIARSPAPPWPAYLLENHTG